MKVDAVTDETESLHKEGNVDVKVDVFCGGISSPHKQVKSGK